MPAEVEIPAPVRTTVESDRDIKSAQSAALRETAGDLMSGGRGDR
jgi:hypothetical protein